MKKQVPITALLVVSLVLALFTGCNSTPSSGTQASNSSVVEEGGEEEMPLTAGQELVFVQEFDPQTSVEKNGLKKQYLFNITQQEGDMHGEFQQINTLTLSGDGTYELQKQLCSISEPDAWNISVVYIFYGSFTREGDEVTLGEPEFAQAESNWGNLASVISIENELVTTEEAPYIVGEFATSFLGHRNLPEPILAYIDESTMSFTLDYEFGTNMFGNDAQYGVDAVEPLEDSSIKGKTILFLGSSVTFGSHSEEETFVEYIAKIDGIHAVKEAVSGTTLSTAMENSYVERLQSVDTDMQIDAMVCQLSTNDATKGMELGEISESYDLESFDTDTITGATEYIICYTLETWNCPVVFYNTPEYNNADYKAMVDMLAALQEKWDITIVDFWNDSEVNEILQENFLLYMGDSIHPTKAGYLEVFTPAIQQVLYDMLAD